MLYAALALTAFGLAYLGAVEYFFFDEFNARFNYVAVEYLMLMSDWHSEDPPEFLGQQMIANETLGLWTLHAWIWRDNPDGLFQTWNANVGPCPGS